MKVYWCKISPPALLISFLHCPEEVKTNLKSWITRTKWGFSVALRTQGAGGQTTNISNSGRLTLSALIKATLIQDAHMATLSLCSVDSNWTTENSERSSGLHNASCLITPLSPLVCVCSQDSLLFWMMWKNNFVSQLQFFLEGLLSSHKPTHTETEGQKKTRRVTEKKAQRLAHVFTGFSALYPDYVHLHILSCFLSLTASYFCHATDMTIHIQIEGWK